MFRPGSVQISRGEVNTNFNSLNKRKYLDLDYKLDKDSLEWRFEGPRFGKEDILEYNISLIDI